jgi:ABC-type multidrug transport system fused ATPase/permease subunit
MITALKRLNFLLSRKDKVNFVVLLFFMVLAALLETVGVGVIPVFVSVIAIPERILEYPLLKPVFEYLSLTTSKELLIYSGFGLFIIFIVKNTFLSIVYYLQAQYTKNRQIDFSHRLFALYINAPYSFHLKHDGSELLRNVNIETQKAITGILVPLQIIVMQGLVLISISTLLVVTEPVITIIAGIILGSASSFFLKALNAKSRNKGIEVQKERQVSIQAINQGFGGIKEVLVSGNRHYFIQQFLKSVKRVTTADAYIRVVGKLTQPFLESIIVVGILAVAFSLMYTGRLIETIAPTLALFGAALIRLKSCMSMIVQSVTLLRYNAVSITPVWNDINKLSSSVPPRATVTNEEPVRLSSSIEIEKLSFCYPETEKPVIKNINLIIPKAASIALVGPTGSGKTTLVDLLLGLLEAEQGSIRVDGVDIFDSLAEWHKKIGYIPQFIYLLNDTVRNNIAFGLEDSEIDPEKLQRAVQTSQLDEFICSLPEGLETIVGERGIRLSGGQRQRIGIARALYNNPEILIMDEATSSLDNTTENLLVKALEELKGDRTIIIIAHRLSTVKNCDQLYFMKDGSIKESGTYEELLSTCNEFRAMVE